MLALLTRFYITKEMHSREKASLLRVRLLAFQHGKSDVRNTEAAWEEPDYWPAPQFGSYPWAVTPGQPRLCFLLHLM